MCAYVWHVHEHVCAHTHACTSLCVYTCVHTCVCVCMCLHVPVCAYLSVCVCVYVCLYVCAPVCARICVGSWSHLGVMEESQGHGGVLGSWGTCEFILLHLDGGRPWDCGQMAPVAACARSFRKGNTCNSLKK